MNKSTPEFSISSELLLSKIKSYPDTNNHWIAFSGGMDSSVLLHLFSEIKNEVSNIEVIYVDHRLNIESEDWGSFCKSQCERYGLPFREIKLESICPDGESLENWAREERYSSIFSCMNENDILYTAHHLDDQIETFFLQSLRGAGPRGLASMPDLKRIRNFYHARPLLDCPQESIISYASQNQLKWIDDDSNKNTGFDRNYLRHEVLPVIAKKWPAYKETISRNIEHQREYKLLLDDVASNDHDKCILQDNLVLDINRLKRLSVIRQKNLIYFWLRRNGLSTPSMKHMKQILINLIEYEDDKSPCVNWEKVELRRYKDRLYACTKQEAEQEKTLSWNISNPITLMNETLSANTSVGKGLSLEKTNEKNFEIRFRSGGEKIRPGNTNCTKTIKQLFQERAVLPWCRDKVPLIYVDNELAMIPGFCIDEKYSAMEDEPSLDIQWTGSNKVFYQ